MAGWGTAPPPRCACLARGRSSSHGWSAPSRRYASSRCEARQFPGLCAAEFQGFACFSARQGWKAVGRQMGWLAGSDTTVELCSSACRPPCHWLQRHCDQFRPASPQSPLHPKQSTPSHPAPQISAGQMHSAAVSAEGDAFLWGYGRFNQLGLGDTEDAEAPVALPPLKGVTAAVACGWQHTLAVTHGGGVLAWGANQVGVFAVCAFAQRSGRAGGGMEAGLAGREHVQAQPRSGTIACDGLCPRAVAAGAPRCWNPPWLCPCRMACWASGMRRTSGQTGPLRFVSRAQQWLPTAPSQS